jgi:diaminopimelate decarboxylase
VGVGKIVGSSVAGLYSTFGIPIQSKRQELKNAFLAYPWLTGVHLHVGSQGCPLELLADGVGILYDFVAEINPERLAAGFPPISVFDIGGGLPISYDSSVAPPSMENYIDLIRKRAPGLFSLNLITEFGRWIFTNPGWIVSRVEYVKHDEYANTAMLHVGADLFLRECLNPIDWQHEYSVLDSQGNLREGIDLQPWTLAGPLCFSGDIIAKGVMLPAIEEGDYLVIHDTGGYTFSMWSRYNSRQTPRILGYRGQEFEILKERESISDMLKFWE